MKNRDYLWCLANEVLDGEEQLARLCPACRSRALEEHCPVCGRPGEKAGESMENPCFDQARFEQLKGGSGA